MSDEYDYRKRWAALWAEMPKPDGETLAGLTLRDLELMLNIMYLLGRMEGMGHQTYILTHYRPGSAAGMDVVDQLSAEIRTLNNELRNT